MKSKQESSEGKALKRRPKSRSGMKEPHSKEMLEGRETSREDLGLRDTKGASLVFEMVRKLEEG